MLKQYRMFKKKNTEETKPKKKSNHDDIQADCHRPDVLHRSHTEPATPETPRECSGQSHTSAPPQDTQTPPGPTPLLKYLQTRTKESTQGVILKLHKRSRLQVDHFH